MSILTMLLLAMLHDTSGIPVYIIRESELGMYDTTIDTVNTIFDFNDKWVLDGRNLPKPKYNVEVIE